MRSTRSLASAILALAVSLLAGCAALQRPDPVPPSLLAEGRFGPPSEPVGTAHVLDVSEAMRRYLAHDISNLLRQKGQQRGLIDALYRRELLRLEYDAGRTRTAAEAFDARAGNCLSLLLMTSALARELNLRVQYHTAYLEETWSRSGDLLFASGHVNVTLGMRSADALGRYDTAELTVDFLPAGELQRVRTREIGEATVLAMYANNRAAESLARGQLDDAYAWAAEALRVDPSFPGGYNTLGVVYMRHGDLALAARVFEHILTREPEHTRALANLAESYRRLGRTDDAQAMGLRLARIEREPPFHWFNLGLQAANAADWANARRFFERELGRASDYHEVHFWLGVADWKLGDAAGAEQHLRRAMENSVTRDQHAIYAAKLAWLREHAGGGS